MKVSQEVVAVLSRCTTEGNALKLPYQLDRKVYVSTNVALAAAGGKWNTKAKAHLFDGDAAEAIEPIILTGQIVAAKQEFGAFFTPGPIADRVIDQADLKEGMRVLEPSAGLGALASRALLAGCVVDCVEVLDKHVHILCSTPYNAVHHQDFLTLPYEPAVFDRVVMNPPFAKQADIAHVTHALKFLKPGGKLVAIMSAGVHFRQDRKATEFRELVADHGGWISELPEGSFAESGTNVNTVMVSMFAHGRSH